MKLSLGRFGTFNIEREKPEPIHTGFRPGSKQDVIARALLKHNNDVAPVMRELLPKVGTGLMRWGPVGTPLSEQQVALRRAVYAVRRALLAAESCGWRA